ncbi:histidinol-phosphate transaminase [Ectothiorhodospiraceae bacterium 2226]|nr:histidinol-phosphate transaminase [Ectothiorhodospiraceae bacterium 2226]
MSSVLNDGPRGGQVDVLKLAAPGVRDLAPYQPGKPLEALAREYGIRDAVKLASNENPLGPSPKALAAVTAVLSGLARYPDGGGHALRAALAERHGVEPAQVVLGNGSNDVLELIARAFLTPADEVVFSAHAFAVYPLVTQAVGARAVQAPARDWGHDLAAMAAAVGPRTRLVFVANPNNPTGTLLQPAALEAFVAGLPAHVIVVVDEAYYEYTRDLAPGFEAADAWLARYPNLVVTRTFSKAYGLAGLRVGYALARPAVADLINRVRQPFNVNTAAQSAALAALEDEAHLGAGLAVNRDGLAQLTAAFARVGLPYIPSYGNFVSVGVGQPAGPVYEALLHKGVIVRPVANYGMPQHLRVSVGLPEENARFIRALDEILNSQLSSKLAGTPAEEDR